VQRLAIKRQDDCGKKRDSRGDDPTTNRPKPTTETNNRSLTSMPD